MKKIIEKHGLLRCIGCLVATIGFLLFIVAAFLKSVDVQMILNVCGLIMFTVGGLISTVNAKDYQLLKSLLWIALTVLIGTWIFSAGGFQGTDFYDSGAYRLGFADIGVAIVNAINYNIEPVMYLLAVGAFYGVLKETDGYKRLINSIAKKLKGNVLVVAIVISFIIMALTSMMSHVLAIFVLLPFFVSILLSMKVDKVSTMAITFGSALVGILGATYGTEALTGLNQILGQEISVGLLYRAIILLVSFALYNLFIWLRLRKKETKESDSEIAELAYSIEPTKKKSSMIPAIITLCVITIVTILGFVKWSSFEITMFSEWHTNLTAVEQATDFNLVKSILGNFAVALGEFELYIMITILIIASVAVGLLSRLSFKEFAEGAYKGIKTMVKPILYFLLVYVIWAMCVRTNFFIAVDNWAFNLTEGLNPFIASFASILTHTFRVDMLYTADAIGGFITTVYASNIDIIHTILTSMYGLVQIIMPTSAVLVLGLTLMKVDYKTWFKYIWLFVVGMLVILLVLFAVLTYI